MARERRSRIEEPFPEPDTLPLMNIILMLILALITMSALLPLGFLSSETQKLARGAAVAAPAAKEKEPLELTVFITEAGFNISAYGNVQMGPADAAGKKTALIPKVPGPGGELEYDYLALQTKLAEIKKKDMEKAKELAASQVRELSAYSEEDSMTVTADPEVKFDVVVKVMDASRFDAEKRILFPKVKFAAGIVS
jgi:biopolymer transport protein ExbD